MGKTPEHRGPDAEKKAERRGIPANSDMGTDDIHRGNVGTGDQNPGDVDPDVPVTEDTGKLPIGARQPPVRPPSEREERTDSNR